MRRCLLALTLVLPLAGCTGKAAVDSTGDATRYIAGSGVITRPRTPKPAPALVGTTLGGATLRLASGTVSVVNFWASWCPPCRDEADGLAAVATETGAHFVGVNIRDDAPNARAFAKRHGTPYPSVFDRYGQIAARWRVPSPPSTYILDARGRIVASVQGSISYSALKPLVAAAVAAGPAS